MTTRAPLLLAALLALGATAASACPNFNLSPTFGDISLVAGFVPDPYTRNITAGGTQSVSGCLGFDWPGVVPTRPDFSLYWNGSTAQLTIAAQTVTDAVLLVNAPDGRTWFFDDDTYGVDPVVVIASPQSGRYDIWVGSYDGSRRQAGRLIVTELPY